MNIGTLGAGAIGQAIAQHAVNYGHDVTLSNRRGPDALAPAVERLGPRAHAGSTVEAAHADIVVLAVPWAAVAQAVQSTGLSDWEGRIVIDTTNQFSAVESGQVLPDLGELIGSEYVASLMPGARVIKAFNTLYVRYIAPDPRHPAGRQLLFLAGDDAAAKESVRDLVDEFGFAPVDIGNLRDGGRLMQLGGPLSALHALRQP